MKDFLSKAWAQAVAGYWALYRNHRPLWVAAHVFALAALIGVVLSIAS